MESETEKGRERRVERREDGERREGEMGRGETTTLT